MNDYQLYSFATQGFIRQLIERGRTYFTRGELFNHVRPKGLDQVKGFSWGVRTLHGKLFVTGGKKGHYFVKTEGQV